MPAVCKRNLLTRFYEIDGGAIYLDGCDIRELGKPELRRRLGLVLQDTYLFATSVLENIRYGRLDASDEEVRRAAVLADADHFIRQLPRGYEDEASSSVDTRTEARIQKSLASTHTELLAKQGQYRSRYLSQFKGEPEGMASAERVGLAPPGALPAAPQVTG